jgi:hypothetical protein
MGLGPRPGSYGIAQSVDVFFQEKEKRLQADSMLSRPGGVPGLGTLYSIKAKRNPSRPRDLYSLKVGGIPLTSR